MNRTAHLIRQTLTIARRDLMAMVGTPMFLLFLLSPLLMIGFGVIGSMSATTAVKAGDNAERVVIIAPATRADKLVAIDGELRGLFSSPTARPPLRIDAPSTDPAAQAQALMADGKVDITAVLYGPLERPTILHAGRLNEANYLARLADQALRADRTGGVAPLSRPRIEEVAREQATSSGKGQAAYFAGLGIFFLTLMLSGQAVGGMAEERSNKVIEILAAAVPLESVFFGKLLGTFGSALIFVTFWGTLFVQLPRLIPGGMPDDLAHLGTATGAWFPLLFVAYFTMSYLLQSAIYLGIGAQAGSQREIQMLSLPITVFQFGMLGFASYANSHPESWVRLAAELFPFSSPLAMAGRAANAPELWPHLLAILWQALWVAITVGVAARMFRRGVLKSSSPKILKRRRPTAQGL